MRLRMRSSSSNLRAAAAVLVALTTPSAFAQQVSGKVTADGSQPIPGAIVKVQAKGGVQTVVSNTADDGSFSFTGIKTDQALLSVEKNGQLLFRSIVSTKTGVPLTINLQKPFQLADWHPADMTADPAQGVLVVDRTGGVSRIRGDTQGPHQDVLFRIPSSYAVSSLAADGGIVVVTTNSAIGCTLFRFTVASGTTDQKVLSPGNTCSGIALLGASMNVVFSKQREVRHWDDWNSSGRVLAGLGSGAALGALIFDRQGSRLLAADTDGHVYAVPLAGGKTAQLTSGAGWIGSLAAGPNHILMASGKKILMISRADNRGENPPSVLQSLTGGTIAGIAFDAAGNFWYADYDHGEVTGPLILK